MKSSVPRAGAGREIVRGSRASAQRFADVCGVAYTVDSVLGHRKGKPTADTMMDISPPKRSPSVVGRTICSGNGESERSDVRNHASIEGFQSSWPTSSRKAETRQQRLTWPKTCESVAQWPNLLTQSCCLARGTVAAARFVQLAVAYRGLPAGCAR